TRRGIPATACRVTVKGIDGIADKRLRSQLSPGCYTTSVDIAFQGRTSAVKGSAVSASGANMIVRRRLSGAQRARAQVKTTDAVSQVKIPRRTQHRTTIYSVAVVALAGVRALARRLKTLGIGSSLFNVVDIVLTAAALLGGGAD